MRASYKAEKQRTSITLIRCLFTCMNKICKNRFYSLLIFLRPNSPVPAGKHVLLLCNTWLYNKICINQISVRLTTTITRQQNTSVLKLRPLKLSLRLNRVKKNNSSTNCGNINTSALNIFHKVLNRFTWKVAFKDHKIVLTLKLSK